MPDVNLERVEAISATIAHGRREGVSVDPLPRELHPTWDEIYHVHDRVHELLKKPAEVGWKVGAAAREIQIKEGLPDAMAGRIYAQGLHETPAQLGPELFINYRLCESEFVLTLGEDLPDGPEPLTVEQVANAVATARAGLEIGDMVFPDWYESSKFWAPCLDNAGGSQLVLGPEHEYIPGTDLGSHTMDLYSDGVFVKQGVGERAMGDPIISATWVVNLRRRAGSRITAGMLLSTGTCTGHHFAERGETVRVDFGTLGAVEATFG